MIELNRVSFSYDAGHDMFDETSAVFRPSETVALTGESGRGKSTLLYLLGLMLRPSAGDVIIEGRHAARLSDRERTRLRSQHFGFVFQDAALDQSRTVIDNVIEGSIYRKDPRAPAVEEAMALLEQFGVELRADAKPGQVSGGQAQRIALCRALLAHPKYLLADEPTGNLDKSTATVVLDALTQRAHAGATVVIATHDDAVIDRCDRRMHLV